MLEVILFRNEIALETMCKNAHIKVAHYYYGFLFYLYPSKKSEKYRMRSLIVTSPTIFPASVTTR
jgi:hypothetical protein